MSVSNTRIENKDDGGWFIRPYILTDGKRGIIHHGCANRLIHLFDPYWDRDFVSIGIGSRHALGRVRHGRQVSRKTAANDALRSSHTNVCPRFHWLHRT